MNFSALFAGFGGQGVQTLGKLLSYAANNEDKSVLFAPSYGGEMRGGTSNCTVVIGDKPISSPNKRYMDAVVVLNEASFDKFESAVKPGGAFIINTSLIEKEATRDDIDVIKVPFSDAAMSLKSDKVLNVVVLGFLYKFFGMVSQESALTVVKEKLGKKEAFRILNENAFALGIQLAEERMG